MNKRYFINDGSQTFSVFSNHKPRNPAYASVVEFPNEMLSEDDRWLQIEQIDVDGVMTDTITIDEALKTSTQAADSATAAQKLLDDAYEADVGKKIARLDFGKRMKAEIAVLNDTKGWNVTQTLTYMSDVNVQTIDGLLSGGAIESARDTILVAPLTAYYTSQEVTDIADKLTNYLTNE